MAVVLAAQRVIDADGYRSDGWIRVDDGRIVEVGEGSAPESAVHGAVLLPGFIDLHCHGGGGGSFTSTDPRQIESAIATHMGHGTTTMHASLVSA